MPKLNINDQEYFNNLYQQKYLQTADKSGKKFNSLDGAVQRAIIEQAMLNTEAYKFSKKYGENMTEERAALIFQHYCDFYAYSDRHLHGRPLKDLIKKDKEFRLQNPNHKDRALARQIEIGERARRIDDGIGKSYNLVRFKRDKSAGRI